MTLYKGAPIEKEKSYVRKNNFVCIALEREVRRVCTLYATDGTRLLISILKLFYICVHEENEEGYDSVPGGNSLCARKLCDVISTPMCSVCHQHRTSQQLEILIGRQTEESLIYGLIYCTVSSWLF
jgi:hypothetical protein